MRSEGFPFIVGVHGVGPVFASFWSCRRRVVVAASSISLHSLRHNPFLQSMNSGGSLARNARFGAPKAQNGRSFSRFAGQAQYFGNVSMQVRRFFVAGAALFCDVAFRDVVAGAAFCDVAKVLFRQIAVSGTRKLDTTLNIVAGAAFGECLGKWRKLRKSHTF